MTTSMNERSHFFIKIYLSYFILERVDVGCEWEVSWRRGHTAILTQSSSFHSSTSFAFWLGCSTVGHWGPKARYLPLALNSASSFQLLPTTNWKWNSNWETQAVCSTWLYNCLTYTCFLWAYASAPISTTSTGQGDIPISSTGCTCFAVLLLIYTGASLDWRLGRESICYKRIQNTVTKGSFCL